MSNEMKDKDLTVSIHFDNGALVECRGIMAQNLTWFLKAHGIQDHEMTNPDLRIVATGKAISRINGKFIPKAGLPDIQKSTLP